MKRAQKVPSGSAAATLVGFITLIFIFYILFLPPGERQELLEGEENTSNGWEVGGLMLDEAPGRLSFTRESVFDHHLANVYLTEASNAKVLARENPFVVKKGWFGEQRKTMVLLIDDLENVDDVMLSFQAPKRSGTLVVTLNGMLIYENSVQSLTPPPVLLPKQMLQSANQLEFSVKGGFLSWLRYDLQDVKVVGNLRDTTLQKATNSFTVSATEADNLESAFIEYYPLCQQDDVGIMTVFVNNRAVFAGMPACDSLNRQDLFVDDLKTGKNEASFMLNKGSARVEQVRVRTVLEPVKTFIDYFNVKSSLYNDILDKERQAVLRIEFVDNDEVKRAQVNFNGKFDSIDQRDNVYERDVSQWIKEGNNYIEIKPLTELEIVRLQVRID